MLKKEIMATANNKFLQNYTLSFIDYQIFFLVENAVSLVRDGVSKTTNEDIKAISEEMVLFHNKAKLNYGIADPIESFLIWTSIVSKKTIGGVLSSGIDRSLLDKNIKKFRREDEEGFLEIPNEDIQKAMGSLPVVDCALAKYINGISEDLLIQARETMGEAIREGNSKIIFLDTSKLMANLLQSVDIKKSAFAASIILEFMRNNNNLPIVLYGNWTYEIKEIENNKEKRRFWLNLGEDTYCKINKGLPLALEDVINGGRRKDTCITIITDSLEDCDEVDDGIEYLKNGKIKVNLVIINEIPRLDNYIKENEIIYLIAKANQKNRLFTVKKGRLTEITEEVKSMR